MAENIFMVSIVVVFHSKWKGICFRVKLEKSDFTYSVTPCMQGSNQICLLQVKKITV